MSTPRARPPAEVAAIKPTPERRTRASKGREARLIDVAARLFHERGYDATSLQNVADELGMLKGSLYHYIASKDDLLHAVILRQHDAALALAQQCRHHESPRDRLAALVRGYAHSLRHERAFVSVYLHDFDRLSPARRRAIRRGEQSYVDFVVDTLRAGVAAGEFRPGLDPELAAQGILGMLNSSYRWYRPRGRHSPTAIVEELLALVLQGVDR